jgi:ABC-2 type transport system ATP-binding protein
MLCGLLEPSAGKIEIAGHDVCANVLSVKDSIGYMAQRFGMYLDLTVIENLHFYAELFGISPQQRDERIVHLLRMTRMDQFRKRPAGRLSGGMKQKLALMCCLLHRPEILILDEPTNGVDPVSRRDFWKILYQLVKEGLTVFVTTAYLDEAERCNRVGLLSRGRLIRCDSPNHLREGLKETCYELECSDRQKAREILHVIPGVASVEPSGAVLHVFLDETTLSPSRVRELLADQALSDVLLRRIAPSLEDIFILEIRKSSRDT